MTRRLALDYICPECGGAFRPAHRQQVCCTRSCGAARRHRLNPSSYLAAARKGQQALQRARWATIAAKVRNCRTLADAYRLGRQDGYQVAWQQRSRQARG